MQLRKDRRDENLLKKRMVSTAAVQPGELDTTRSTSSGVQQRVRGRPGCFVMRGGCCVEDDVRGGDSVRMRLRQALLVVIKETAFNNYSHKVTCYHLPPGSWSSCRR